MKNCTLCKENNLTELLDLGLQPISHRFVKKKYDKEIRHPLKIGQCKDCSLIQITSPFPYSDVQPIYDWLECTEPEAHLDHFVNNTLSKLENLSSTSSICGVSFKEESTLDRLCKLGFTNTWTINLQKDLKIKNKLANIETLQEKLTQKSAKTITDKYGKSDLAIARHIIEHAYDLKEFVLAIKSLVKTGGYVYLEVPDCVNALKKFDYTTIWEEHISYFTPNTFKSLLLHCGLELEYFETIPYPLEDSHIAIAKVLADEVIDTDKDLKKIQEELELGSDFSSNFKKRKKNLNKYLEQFKEENGPIAIFGAAHMSSIFINLLDISSHIEFVTDDNWNKQGYLMPGSKLPILSSGQLISRGIKLCLLSLAPASEEKVLKMNQSYIDSGGKFLSIFPSNFNSIPYGEL